MNVIRRILRLRLIVIDDTFPFRRRPEWREEPGVRKWEFGAHDSVPNQKLKQVVMIRMMHIPLFY